MCVCEWLWFFLEEDGIWLNQAVQKTFIENLRVCQAKFPPFISDSHRGRAVMQEGLAWPPVCAQCTGRHWPVGDGEGIQGTTWGLCFLEVLEAQRSSLWTGSGTLGLEPEKLVSIHCSAICLLCVLGQITCPVRTMVQQEESQALCGARMSGPVSLACGHLDWSS